MGKYLGFCLYRRSPYSLWSSVNTFFLNEISVDRVGHTPCESEHSPLWTGIKGAFGIRLNVPPNSVQDGTYF